MQRVYPKVTVKYSSELATNDGLGTQLIFAIQGGDQISEFRTSFPESLVLGRMVQGNDTG